MSFGASKQMRRTLSFRLTAWYASLFFLSTVILFGVTYGVLARSLQRRDRNDLRAALKIYKESYHRGGQKEIEREVNETQDERDHSRFLVRLAQGAEQTRFLDGPASWRKQFDLAFLARMSMDNGRAIFRVPSLDGDEEVLEVIASRLDGNMLLQVGRSTKQREDLLERYRQAFLAVLFPVLLVSIAGGAFLTSRALRPLRWLIATLQRSIATGALTTRAPEPDTQDELRELTQLFNTLLERISLLIGGMQGTLDNVAHDLRTPLTRLRGLAELALQNNAPDSDLREALATCLEESERILAMLNMLMDISEAEHGAMKLERTPLTVQALVAQAVELYSDVAEEKGVRLSTDVPPDLQLLADCNRMAQVVANLLDNALKYTPQGGQISITAGQRDSHIVLAVQDTGIGIAPEDLPHIWERLYRGDKSRSERGLGLGLSVVKAIVQAHGGSVTVHSTPGNGSVFSVTLPVLPPQQSSAAGVAR